MKKIFILASSYIVIFPNCAYAYLDPGTGSIILQAIIGFLAASVTAVSIYWSKFKSLISKIFNRKEKEKDKSNSDD
tara:strand:- start:196 stop:423 length:228 start_codon:yes stop_codon:yes gene_type:complete